LLTLPADEQAFARAILRLKTDPALRLRIGREVPPSVCSINTTSAENVEPARRSLSAVV